MGNTTQPLWAETNGSRYSAQTPHYNQIAPGKDSTHFVRVVPLNPGLESVSLLAKKIIVTAVIPASVLAQEVIVVTRTPVESWHWLNRQKMMGTKTSRPWDSFSFNNVVVIAPSWFFFKVNSRVFFLRQNVFLETNSLWKARLNLRW